MEAIAIAHHFDGYGWQYIDNGSGSDWLSVGKKYDDAIVLVDQDDALALVAAAYSDAADAIYADGEYVLAIGLSRRILARTPADAEANLTEIERAAYERGVRDTLAAADREAKGKVHIGGQAFRTVKLDDLEPAALALLNSRVTGL